MWETVDINYVHQSLRTYAITFVAPGLSNFVFEKFSEKKNIHDYIRG